MKNLHKYLAILVICCIGNAAWAAKEMQVANGGQPGYASDPIEITNWVDLQEEFKEAYGSKVFVANTPMELESFEDDKSPKAFILLMGDVDIFSVINQPAPPRLGSKILELFSDLKKTDFNNYDQGVTLFAQENKNGGHTLVAILLKSREKSDSAPSAMNLITLKIDDKLSVGFPLGTEVISDDKIKASGIYVRNYSVEVPLSPQDAATYITTQLSEANVRFSERTSSDSASITFRRKDARATVTTSIYDDEKQTSLILFIIYSKN